jgi:hypothetical protein
MFEGMFGGTTCQQVIVSELNIIKRCLIIIVAFQAAINNFRNVGKLQTNQTSD